MENKEEIIKWEQEEPEEQQLLQEDETNLILTKSRHGRDNDATHTAALDVIQVINGVSQSNGHAGAAANSNGAHLENSNPDGEEQKLEKPDGIHKIDKFGVVLQVAANGAKEEDSTQGEDQRVEEGLEGVTGIVSEVINGEPKPENLVFYDNIDGVDSTCTHITEKQNLKDPEDNTKFNISSNISSLGDSVVQNTKAVRSTFEGDFEKYNFPGSKIQPSQNPFQDHSKTHKSSTEIESIEVDVINEDDLEVTEFDVERVLQKQTTHDLYCPNCNSCITKRVILHKRKRRIRISEEDVKRNKTELVVTSKLGAGTAPSSNGQVWHTDEVDDNDTQLLKADEDERNQGPAIFRCLSCFSFFIPIGNGFKSFRLFVEKNGKESAVDEQGPNVKKNRFTSLFSSNKQKTALGQGSSSQKDAGVVASSNSINQIGQPSSLRKADSPSHASEVNVAISGNNDTLKSRDGILSFPEQKPSSNGKLVIAVGDQLDMAVDSTKGPFDSYAEDQLKETNYISHKSDLSVTAVPTTNQFTNEESVEDDVSFPTGGGLKLLISPNTGSLAPENLKESGIPNQAMQSGVEEGAYTDEEAIHTAASISVLKMSDMNGTLNNSVSAPPEKEDSGVAAPIESVLENENSNFRIDIKSGIQAQWTGEAYPPIIAKTKIPVHSDKPLKVDSISYSPAGQGKDAVITVDPQPTGSSQIVPDIIHPAETTTSSHPATQIGTAGRERTEEREEFEIEVIKSIVYGGLAESITSLSVVSSAAGGGAATLNIAALGMANLIGGLFIICHNIWELRSDCTEQVSNQISEGVVEQRDRYKELLGRRQNFILHVAVAIISYLVFGLVPPVLYGLSFRKTDDKQLKLVVVAAASLLCIALLAVGRAYVRRPPKPYLKSVMSFVILGFMVSGVSYAAGELVERLLVKLGLFKVDTLSNLLVAEMMPKGTAWASY